MATLQQIVDALDTYIEGSTGLNITCIKGYPDFRRANLTTPIAALFYGGSGQGQGEQRQRVGASTTAVVVTLNVYASNEVNLFALAALLQSMRDAKTVLTAGSDSQKIKVYIGDDEREPPDDEAPKELRHVITAPVVLVFE